MFNEVTLVGNLGQVPELRFTPAGRAVCDLNIACNERWTDANNNRQERTVWVRCAVWGKQAETVSEYLTKGRQVLVKGRIEEPEAWTDREGNPRATLKVTAQRVLFLGGGNGDNAPTVHANRQPVHQNGAMDVPFDDDLADDEIPW